VTYPEAACSPKPRDPPVTTATFPSREKMSEKLLSLTCSSADILVTFRSIEGEEGASNSFGPG
jgi:hypothetical protein